MFNYKVDDYINSCPCPCLSLELFKEIFENEFNKLISIGNNFRICHHETTKIDIEG